MEDIPLKVYIYALRDPRTGEIRYIGSTTDPERRLHTHWSTPQTQELKKWMGELRLTQMKPKLDVIAETTPDERDLVEWQWIDRFSQLGQILNLNCYRPKYRNPGIDSPLRRRRLEMGLTQKQIAEQCGMKADTYARYEQRQRIPRLTILQAFLEVTGLPIEALVLPEQYLIDHPEFLAQYAAPLTRRGRPPKA